FVLSACLFTHPLVRVSLSLACPIPAPPFLPYTTLFRSVLGREAQLLVEVVGERRHRAHDVLERQIVTVLLLDENIVRSVSSLTEDRKSTRLNSSHEWSSYAVFCLKKKLHAHGDAVKQPA